MLRRAALSTPDPVPQFGQPVAQFLLLLAFVSDASLDYPQAAFEHRALRDEEVVLEFGLQGLFHERR